MSDSMRRPVSKLSFITTMLTKRQIGAGAGAHGAADEIDRVVELAGRLASSCPESSSDAASSRQPGLPFGSSAPPARTIIRMLTTGCSWCSTATTCSPLGSVWSW